MGLHLAIQEQIATNRPTGITTIYQTLKKNGLHPLEVEHRLMRCLEESLWQAQQNNTRPNEVNYLKSCQALI